MISYTKGSQKQVLAKIRGDWGICGGLAVVQFVVVLLETGSNFQRPTCLCQAQTLMLNDSDTVWWFMCHGKQSSTFSKQERISCCPAILESHTREWKSMRYIISNSPKLKQLQSSPTNQQINNLLCDKMGQKGKKYVPQYNTQEATHHLVPLHSMSQTDTWLDRHEVPTWLPMAGGGRMPTMWLCVCSFFFFRTLHAPKLYSNNIFKKF